MIEQIVTKIEILVKNRIKLLIINTKILPIIQINILIKTSKINNSFNNFSLVDKANIEKNLLLLDLRY